MKVQFCVMNKKTYPKPGERNYTVLARIFSSHGGFLLFESNILFETRAKGEQWIKATFGKSKKES